MTLHVNTTTDSVRIVIFDSSNKSHFLILSESDDPKNLKLPGGKFNSTDEKPIEAAYREVSEELSLRIDQIDLKQASELVNDDGISRRFIFFGICDKNLIHPSREIEYVEWVTEEIVPEVKNHDHILSAVDVCKKFVTRIFYKYPNNRAL